MAIKKLYLVLLSKLCRELYRKRHIALSGALDGYPDELAKELTKQLGYPPERIYYAGAAITINSGPDLIGVCFKGIKRR